MMQSIDMTYAIKPADRNLSNFYEDRLLCMGTVCHLLLEGIEDPNLKLTTLFLAGQLAYSKAGDHAEEVIEYIKELERRLEVYERSGGKSEGE